MTEIHIHLFIGSFPTELSLRLMKPVVGKGTSHTVSFVSASSCPECA